MATPLSPAQSTRLENLSPDALGLSLELDGRSVRLRNDSAGPAAAAFQAFYRHALGDYQALPSEPRAGWLSRLKSWVGRLLGAPPAPPPAIWVVPPAASAPPPVRPAAPPPAASSAAGPKAPAPPPSARPGPGRTQPVLRAVYADREGVHVFWSAPAAEKAPSKPVALTYALDSELARRLQDCYGHLTALGYRVAGLEAVLRPEPAAAAPVPKAGARPAAKKPAPAPSPRAAPPERAAGQVRAKAAPPEPEPG